MTDRSRVPTLPPVAAALLRRLPLAAVEWPLKRTAAVFARRHPAALARLGDYAERRFLIDPLDLPFVFRLRPRPPVPEVEVLARSRACHWDARIAGPLAALLGLVHGTLDGDALFFSRDLVVEGDTEAVLALRNALDNAELDLLTEAAAAFAPIGPRIRPLARVAAREASRLSGVALTRPGP